MTYYVSPSGSDLNSGTSIDQPFATLAAANAAIVDGVGGTVYLRAGTYALASWTKGGSPTRPLVIRAYPGEHAVISNGVTATWTNIGGGIWRCTPPTAWVTNITGNFGTLVLNGTVVPLGDRPCVMAPALSHLTSPTTVHGASDYPITDDAGDLLYNVCFYDAAADRLYFRSATSATSPCVAVTDPNTQLMLSEGQVSIEPTANYYQFRDIAFRYVHAVHQQAPGDHTNAVFDNCTFKYQQLGIVGGGTGAQITNCWMDKCGAYRVWGGTEANGNYYFDNQYHCLYLNGHNMLVSDNIVSRQGNGFLMQFYDQGLVNGVIENNILLDGYGGVMMGAGWRFDNNIMLGCDAIRPYISAQNFRYVGNYMEGNRIAFATFGTPTCNFTGGFQITDNILSGIELYGTIDISRSLIDRNVYIPFCAHVPTVQRVPADNPDFIIGPAVVPTELRYIGLTAWRAALVGAGAAGWDVSSLIASNAPVANGQFYSLAAMWALLDSATADQVRMTIRGYVDAVRETLPVIPVPSEDVTVATMLAVSPLAVATPVSTRTRATFTYPNDDLDDVSALLGTMGTLWSDLYAGNDFTQSYVQGLAALERQAFNDMREAVRCTARATTPVFHKELWRELVIRQSEGNSVAGRLRYGDGAVFGDNHVFGGFDNDTAYFTYPVDASLARLPLLCNRVTQPSATFFNGIDYQLQPLSGQLTFRDDPFSNPDLARREVFDEAGVVADYEISLWMYHASFDRQYPYMQWGYPWDFALPSSQNYLRLLQILWSAAVGGTSAREVFEAVATALDVPFALADETVKVIENNTRTLLIATDRNVYHFNPLANVLVAVGDFVHRGQALTDIVQPFEFNRGQVPAAIAALHLDPGFLLDGYYNGVTFENKEVPVEVTYDKNNIADVRFALGGWPLDVDKFWEDFHARGLAAGQTLADLLGPRIPATINPLQFLCANVLRNHAFAIQIRASLLGPQAAPLSVLRILRRIVPPHTAMLTILELEAPADSVTISEYADQIVSPTLFRANRSGQETINISSLVEQPSLVYVGGHCI